MLAWHLTTSSLTNQHHMQSKHSATFSRHDDHTWWTRTPTITVFTTDQGCHVHLHQNENKSWERLSWHKETDQAYSQLSDISKQLQRQTVKARGRTVYFQPLKKRERLTWLLLFLYVCFRFLFLFLFVFVCFSLFWINSYLRGSYCIDTFDFCMRFCWSHVSRSL